jgi:hypothetical protein
MIVHPTPHILCQKLEVSTAALKQHHKRRSNARWKKNWAKSKWGKQDHQINDSSPSKQFIGLISNPKISRSTSSDSSLISQLHISHVPLNSCLYRFKCVDSPRCPAFGESTETVEHFLISCPTYAHECWALEKTIKCKPDPKTLLGDHKAAMLKLPQFPQKIEVGHTSF